MAVILPKSAIKLIMKKILSTISVVFCVISAKSQLNFIQDFENIQTVLQQFGVVNLVKSDQYEICNVTSLAIRESGYGSLISNPSTITFKKNFELLAGKDVYLSFKYRFENKLKFHKMKLVVRYEISSPYEARIHSGNLGEIFIDSKDFDSSNCLDFTKTMLGSLLFPGPYTEMKIFFDLYSTSYTGISTVFIIDDFKLSQTKTLNTTENINQASEIFPNPFDKYIELQNIENVAKITITDISGKNILEKINPTKKIDLQNLSKGIYIITIADKNGKKYSKKIIKK